MELFSEIDTMRQWCRSRTQLSQRIGLVPTMGALHEGHLSLVRHAKSRCDNCVATIFVNPNQFAPTEDLGRYPRPLDADLEQLQAEGVDVVFLPTDVVMYPPGFGTYVTPPPLASPLEGVSRPEHFRGVTTVVLKLMQIIPADAAFFGEKDYQQLRVITQMVQDLNVATEVVPCPIVREHDGLAMSSRNRFLMNEQRERALSLSRALVYAAERFATRQFSPREIESEMLKLLSPCDRVDYAVVVDAATLSPIDSWQQPAVALIAAWLGDTRLIDNRILM